MTNNRDHLSAEDKQRTDEAWMKLQSKLAGERPNAKWAEWPIDTGPASLNEAGAAASAFSTEAQLDGQVKAKAADAASAGAGAARPSRRSWSRRGKWAATAAACALFGTFLMTPIGDKALASILNQFRMQNVVAVNEDDLRNVFNKIMQGEDATHENMNRFGAFLRNEGKLAGEFTPADAEAKLGYKLINGLADAKGNVWISPSTTLTMKMNIGEVNQTMKRLGATKLMPEALDGKSVSLNVPETVTYELGADDKYASLSQQKVPVITVDPSVEAEDAIDAVLDFPLMPAYLKEGLQQNLILSGEIPFPVIADSRSTLSELRVDGTKVLLEKRDNGPVNSYKATWVKDNMLYSFYGGNAYTTQQKVEQKIGEWIGG